MFPRFPFSLLVIPQHKIAMSAPTLKIKENPKAPKEKEEESTWDKVKSKLMAVHLPIILLLAIGIGIFFPQPGKQ